MQADTVTQLQSLKLRAMADCYVAQSANPAAYATSFDDRLAQMVDAEVSTRKMKKLERSVRAARLPFMGTIEDVDYSIHRGLDKRVVSDLATCEYIAKRLNVIVTGPSGVGKTHIGIALLVEACRHGKSALFCRYDELEDQISTAIDSGSLPDLKGRLLAPSVLLIDDFALVDMGRKAVEVLLHVIDRRSRAGSIIITSQFPTDHWHSRLADPTLANAVLDRIVHTAVRLNLKGESVRKTQGKKLRAKVADEPTDGAS